MKALLNSQVVRYEETLMEVCKANKLNAGAQKLLAHSTWVVQALGCVLEHSSLLCNLEKR